MKLTSDKIGKPPPTAKCAKPLHKRLYGGGGGKSFPDALHALKRALNAPQSLLISPLRRVKKGALNYFLKFHKIYPQFLRSVAKSSRNGWVIDIHDFKGFQKIRSFYG
jgi:hypothetical protein